MAPEKLPVDLLPETARLVQEAVASGAFASIDEAIAAALHLWKDQQEDGLFGFSREEMDRLVDEGIASGPGQGLSIEHITREGFRRAGVPYPGA